MSNKKYGLILPDKGKSQQLLFQASRNIFGNDSDSESESKKPVLLRPSHNIIRQAKTTQDKAIMEDPTVYQYDEIYDSMTSQKEENKAQSKEEKKPRYIENLMKTANKRKIENECRIERQIQKEREKEGDMYDDKEVFVTSAYKKKLEEMRLEEEKEKREEYLESIGDVTKQRDLGGFYRHLYEQTLGSEKSSSKEKIVVQDHKDVSEEKHLFESKKEKESFKTLKKRNYRKRKSSQDHNENLSEGEIEDSDEEINRFNLKDIKNAKRSKFEKNIDADSDFSIDDPSDDENTNAKVDQEKNKLSLKNKELDTPAKNESPGQTEVNIENNIKEAVNKEDNHLEKEVKPKVDIWQKRTVGKIFEEALKRYYERKATRGM